MQVGDEGPYFYMPSTILVLKIGFFFELAEKGDGSFIQKFGDGAVKAGLIFPIIGITHIFDSAFAYGYMSKIGPALAGCTFYNFIPISFESRSGAVRLEAKLGGVISRLSL